jgi:hypothetical protein
MLKVLCILGGEVSLGWVCEVALELGSRQLRLSSADSMQ